jgi:hypothetical protein
MKNVFNVPGASFGTPMGGYSHGHLITDILA